MEDRTKQGKNIMLMEGIIIQNRELGSILLQTDCPEWCWSLYEKPGWMTGEEPRYYARMEHSGTRFTADLEFSMDDPAGSFMESVRGIHEDYRAGFEETGLGFSRDLMTITGELYDALHKTVEERNR